MDRKLLSKKEKEKKDFSQADPLKIQEYFATQEKIYQQHDGQS